MGIDVTATSASAVSSREAALHIRRTVLKQSKRAGVGHIGSALSVADLIAAAYEVMDNINPDDADRDRFVLSKGHAALALFAMLNHIGQLSESDLDTYCADDSLLGVHPENALRGIDFSTGSLGQGLPMAVGAALAAKMQGSSRRVIALVSDAECNEGSIWEAAMFAGHHRLSGLTAIIDLNEQQALGFTRDVSSVDDMAARWRAFGWDTIEVDGHDHDSLIQHLSAPARPDAAPRVLVARTTFGCGVSFMERQIKWHYLPMNDEQFADAMNEVEAGR
ncbi:transketolase subunit A [Frankineae bacterium MT45]|nr:transketolase subunit A [Frankineae bacterium MT45]